MKPVAFDYEAPVELDAALDVLARRGEDAKALAGGQSLVPLLNFRLVRPAVVVDLNGIGALAYLRRIGGALRIGAMTREAALERSRLVAAGWPLLAECARHIGHPQIRNRGTVGGSVAHADPAAELPVVLTALDARFHVQSARGGRTLAASALFQGYLETALAPDELLVEIEVPPLPARTGTAFHEWSRLHGDFALAGAAAVVTLDGAGACARVALALLGAGPTPRRATAAEAALAGAQPDDTAVDEAAVLAADAAELVGPDAEHRRALLRTVARRALAAAAARAERA
jgi:CO/xanthine dehydrogenase FAD-binding subunit